MGIIIPQGDDGIITRAKMPQIAQGDIPELLSYLGSFDIGFKAGRINPKLVKAHQAIDLEKAMNIPRDVLSVPVILSNEPYVIDGDHRWYRLNVENLLMPYIMIEEDFNTALKYIFSFPKTYESEK